MALISLPGGLPRFHYAGEFTNPVGVGGGEIKIALAPSSCAALPQNRMLLDATRWLRLSRTLTADIAATFPTKPCRILLALTPPGEPSVRHIFKIKVLNGCASPARNDSATSRHPASRCFPHRTMASANWPARHRSRFLRAPSCFARRRQASRATKPRAPEAWPVFSWTIIIVLLARTPAACAARLLALGGSRA